MVIGCSTLGLTMDASPDIRETLAQIRRLGFEACDVAIFENWQNVNPSSLVTGNEAWIAALLEGLDATGLRVSSLNCGLSRQLDDPDPAAFDQHRREMDALLDLAACVDCTNITVQPGLPISGHEIDALIALTQQRLAQLGPVAQSRGVKLSVEGHQGSLLEHPVRAVAMMESLSPVVGFTYDPSHWAMQRIPLPDTARLLPYTYHVHVRHAAPDRMQAPAAETTVDFAWLVEALAASGYAGAVTIEYFNGFDPDFAETLALQAYLEELGLSR
jgi:sugar phosphate isomerase/epimerase